MHAISSYRGNRAINTHIHKQTNPQTGPITIHCAAASAQCNEIILYWHCFLFFRTMMHPRKVSSSHSRCKNYKQYNTTTTCVIKSLQTFEKNTQPGFWAQQSNTHHSPEECIEYIRQWWSRWQLITVHCTFLVMQMLKQIHWTHRGNEHENVF